MDAKTRRVMKAKQGKVNVGSGSPARTEGYEGQVEVRNINGHATLYARLDNKWIEVPMGAGKDTIPRIWTTTVVMPSSSGGVIAVVPKFIPLDNIISLNCTIQRVGTGANIFYQTIPENSGALTAFGIRITIIEKTRNITAAVLASLYQGKNARVTIFYK
jgi:hypothetical protein